MAAEKTKARSRHDHCEPAGTNDTTPLNLMSAFAFPAPVHRFVRSKRLNARLPCFLCDEVCGKHDQRKTHNMPDFISLVVEVKSEDRGKFFDALSALLA